MKQGDENTFSLIHNDKKYFYNYSNGDITIMDENGNLINETSQLYKDLKGKAMKTRETILIFM